METKYNYNEFLAFVLLYASHVDIEYSEEEKEAVKALVSEKSYDKIYNEFIEMSDYAALQVILSYKGLYYPTPDRKAELLEKIKDLFYADGEYSTIERELLHFLQNLM